MSDAAPPTVAVGPRRWVAFACLGLLWVPVAAAVARFVGLHWTPVGDVAQAALRFVDFTAAPPLVGAAGRIVASDGVTQGNHPGPLMFDAVWPFHALFGSSGTAFAAATAAVNACWIAVAVALGYRRLGNAVVWLSAVIAVLLGQYGLEVLTQLWNPWAALLPFLAFLLAAWSFLDGDPMLPLVALAGSYAVQCHVGYAVPVGVIGLAVLATRVVGSRRAAPPWRRPGLELVATATVTALAWLGPLIDEARHEPGNLTVLVQYFRGNTEPVLGWGRAVRMVGGLLDPTAQWLATGPWPGGRWWSGWSLVAVWAVLALRRRGRSRATRRHLDLVLGAAVLASVVAVSRVFGEPFLYLFRWVTTLTALMVFAVGWGVVEETRAARAERTQPVSRSTGASRRPLIAGLAVLTVATAVAVPRILTADPPFPFGWRTASALAPMVVDHVDPTRRYLINWDDPTGFGDLGYGLMLRLGHAGIEVGTDTASVAAVERERIMTPADADSRLVVVSWSRVPAWRAAYPAAEIATVDVRTPEQRERATELRARAASGLGVTEAELATRPFFGLALDPKVPQPVRDAVGELIQLGGETAVFMVPSDAPNPPSS